MTYIILIGIFLFYFLYWKNRKIKNSHKIPQKVIIKEIELSNNLEDNKELEKIRKGHKLTIERKLVSSYNLIIKLNTNGKNLKDLKKIIISWSGWEQRIFNFNYLVTDENVRIENDNIIIDIGSFNNCQGSRNFIKRTYNSEIIRFDLLYYIPEHNDFEWEKNTENRSTLIPLYSKKELKQFKKGLHYLDS